MFFEILLDTLTWTSELAWDNQWRLTFNINEIRLTFTAYIIRYLGYLSDYRATRHVHLGCQAAGVGM